MASLDLLENLSSSSRGALDWAYTWTQITGTGKVDSIDLLIGVLQSHETGSPALQILRFFDLSPDQLYNNLRYAPDKMPPSRLSLPGAETLDPEAFDVLERSHKVAAEYNAIEEGLVRLRDLFGALLLEPSEARKIFRAALEPASIPYIDLMQHYTSYLRAQTGISLTEILAGRFPEAAPSGDLTPSIQLAVSGFSADTRSERDLVGIRSEVDAFAYLISNKELQPPLAIGLFGDWGSGKTYFMQSVKERVHQITAGARESGTPQKDLKIFKHIVQIEFNAWHYVEGELWASLVESIFQNLQTRPGDETSLLHQRQRVWLEKLESLRDEEGAAQVLKDELESERAEKEQQVSDLKEELAVKRQELDELKTMDVLSTIELSKEDRNNLNQILQQYGIDETYTAAAEFMGALAGLRSTLEQGNALTMALRQRGWQWTVGVIAVIVIGPLISIALSYFSQLEVPTVTNALISISAFLGGLTALMKAGTNSLSTAIEQVNQAQYKLEARRRSVEAAYHEKIAALQAEVAEITARYQQTEAEEQEIARQIEVVEHELLQITPRRVLLDFIRERSGSEDYSKRLGVAALIRRDFDQLWQLIRDQNAAYIENDNGLIKEEDRHLINRIVLYIDDLDRCPPDRVVHVLQAAHLLLAFPMFVVVIAVDARWLSQSLQKHYEGLLSTGSDPDGKGPDNSRIIPATPQNYLEKIFQIPFWIKPLHESARQRIVQGLVEKSLVSEEPEEADENGAGRETQADSIVEWKAEETGREYSVDFETDSNPASLDILEVELKFMEDLRTLLGATPRSVKRFVNVYWLMKSMAMTEEAPFIQEGAQAAFKQVLFLLAVLTGLPTLSYDFFTLINQNGLSDLLSVEGAPNLDTQTDPTLENAIHTLIGIGARRSLTPDEKADYGHEIERLSTWIQSYDEGSWETLPISAFKQWAPQVARFSYRMEGI